VKSSPGFFSGYPAMGYCWSGTARQRVRYCQSMVGMWKDLWKKQVLSLEWKIERATDGRKVIMMNW